MAIESRWFRVHRTGSGTDDDPYRPEYSDRVEGFSSFQLNESPVMAMRAYAEPEVLDEIAGEPRASEITTSEALKAFGDDAVAEAEISTEEELETRFRLSLGEGSDAE